MKENGATSELFEEACSAINELVLTVQKDLQSMFGKYIKDAVAVFLDKEKAPGASAFS